MARARLLRPGFFANEELAELPMAARLLFAGLWTIADREGRLADRPRRIKAELFPYDDVDVDAMLASLEARGFVLRYEVEGERYIQVVSFAKHQQPHWKEPPSGIPEPTEQACAKHEPTLALVPRSDPAEAEADPVTDPETVLVIAPDGAEPKRITAAFREEMRLAFPDLDEGAEFDKATNHVAYRKAIDKRRYYRQWLENSRKYAAERRNGHGNAPGRNGAAAAVQRGSGGNGQGAGPGGGSLWEQIRASGLVASD